ncbi:hypothetical protein HNQ38_002873, partial [Desulfovibrio intestinalis]|nr:hypothetical protein [Desulfovibrio intestinalis]
SFHWDGLLQRFLGYLMHTRFSRAGPSHHFKVEMLRWLREQTPAVEA